LVGKSKGKKTLGRPRHRWKINSKLNLEEMAWKSVDWIHLTHDRDHYWALVNTVMNFWIP
jgi:hypothetical protein